ncbi:MAG TPA: glycoside hydrolase family 2 TIM barrel-domain containing protein [Marmoricola sp.]|nr:glycoside hydrolase family 2 TIM barrel-domain containing protein [Marmoricola sp.]
MLTRWGRDLDPDRPLPEYPRPQLARPDLTWRNLNGRWQHAFGTEQRPESWDGEIVVPFSPESLLSGVGRQLRPDEWLWYRRSFAVPTGPDDGRVLLHFGAVDQTCTVWVNGVEVGTHTGGYLPFTLDVTDALVGTNSGEHQLLEVRVRDLSETGLHARGKQRLDRGTIWYTAQSGIWQTVWVEVVPSTYIRALEITPDPDGAAFLVRADLSDGASVDRRVELAERHLWTPDDPYLHWFDVTIGADTVRTYGALRTFGIGTDERGRRRFLLNGEPIWHLGVLDQGYWPDGLLTPPSDEAMVHDITAMKELGFNVLRKHVKVEPLRWYHHCDRLGMLVWQDMVNGGGRYRHLVATMPATRPVRISDHRHSVYLRGDADARAEFRDEVRRTVELLRNAPSVAVWTPFNEGWGQFDANEIAASVQALDPTRPVNHVSGWVDQGGGDVKSFHSYLRPFRLPRRWRRRRERRVYALTEYGGYSLKVDGHDWSTREFGNRHFYTPDELAAGFVALHREQIEPAIEDGLAATIYTQLSDVEDELNGLMTWDREVLKIPAEVIRATLVRLGQR